MSELALPLPTNVDGARRRESADLVRDHFAFVWRLLRRLGLPESDADDAAQQVFLVAVTRLQDIESGRERSFLYGCALNWAAKWRATMNRGRRDIPLDALEQEQGAASLSGPEEALDRQRARTLLDAVLRELPDQLRVVFVLFELEQLSSVEIAEVLGVPRGTVATRLRRAREEFQQRVRRLEARLSRQGVEQ